MIKLTSKERKLNLLGLAFKAGKVTTGEDLVIKSMQHGKAKIVFVASDSSSSTIDKFDKKCFFYKVEDYSIDTRCSSLFLGLKEITRLSSYSLLTEAAMNPMKEI